MFNTKEDLLKILVDNKFNIAKTAIDLNVPETSFRRHFFKLFRNENDTNVRDVIERLTTELLNKSIQNIANVKTEERSNLSEIALNEKSGRYKTILTASDFHDIDCDDFSLKMFLEVAKETQPDVICINGDLFDLPEFSKFGVDKREFNVLDRMQFGHNVLKQLRDSCKNTQIDLIEGNHEFRLFKFLSTKNDALKSLLGDFLKLKVEDLFRLRELDVNYITKANLQANKKNDVERELEKNYKIYYDTVLFHHFPAGSQFGLPGANGHHHKLDVRSLFNHDRGSYQWYQTGSMCKREADFCNAEKWNNGFLLSHVDTKDKKVAFEYIDTTNDFCVFNRKVYER